MRYNPAQYLKKEHKLAYAESFTGLRGAEAIGLLEQGQANLVFSKKLISKGPNICLIASRKETNKFLNQNFKDYLEHQSSLNHDIKLKVEIKSPAEEKALQATDCISWAIFRKYEYGDDSYSNIIRSKIVEENPLYPWK